MATNPQSNYEVATITKLSQSLGSVFSKLAPDELSWPQEKQFLLAQINALPQAKRAVESPGEVNEQTLESLKTAVRECAAMGLSMSIRAKLVYLIPRRARWRDKQGGETQAEYERTVPWLIYAEPSYMGLAYIMTHYAGASDVAAEVVYKADKFVYRGPMEKPTHEPTLDNEQRTEKHAIGAYALARMASGTWRCEYVDAPTVQRIRGMSDRPNSTMYTTLWTEGWRKIAVRRLAKLTMTANDRMQAAEGAMQAAEGFTFDNDGKLLETGVPRGTSANEDGQEPRSPAKGLGGLDEKLLERQATASEPREPAEQPVTVIIECSLAAPEPSDHPPGSIEWWCDQVGAAVSLGRLDEIKLAALTEKLDSSEHAPTFRDVFKRKAGELRARAKAPPAVDEGQTAGLFT